MAGRGGAGHGGADLSAYPRSLRFRRTGSAILKRLQTPTAAALDSTSRLSRLSFDPRGWLFGRTSPTSQPVEPSLPRLPVLVPRHCRALARVVESRARAWHSGHDCARRHGSARQHGCVRRLRRIREGRERAAPHGLRRTAACTCSCATYVSGGSGRRCRPHRGEAGKSVC